MDSGREGEVADWAMNLATVMPFESSAEAISSLPLIAPRVPEELTFALEVEEHPIGQDELVSRMAVALCRASTESGFSLADDDFSRFVPRSNDPPILKSLLCESSELATRKVKERCRPIGSTKTAWNEPSPCGAPAAASDGSADSIELGTKSPAAQNEEQIHVHGQPIRKTSRASAELSCSTEITDPPRPTTEPVTPVSRKSVGELTQSNKEELMSADVPQVRSIEEPKLEDEAAVENTKKLLAEGRRESFLDQVDEILASLCRPRKDDTEETSSARREKEMDNLVANLQYHANAGDLEDLPRDFLRKIQSHLTSLVESPLHVPDKKAKAHLDYFLSTCTGAMKAVQALILFGLSSHSNWEVLFVEETVEILDNFLRLAVSRLVIPMRDYSATSGKRPGDRSKGHVDDLLDEEETSAIDGLVQRITEKEGVELYNRTISVFEKIATLFTDGLRFSDSAMARLSSTAILPFRSSNATSLQISCMLVVRSVFRACRSCREQILFELRQAMEERPSLRESPREYRLRGGNNSVRVTSALVAQLVQCAATIPGLFMPYSSSMVANTTKEAHMSRSSAVSVASSFTKSLLNRALMERDNDFKQVLILLFEDLLVLYGKPEWPGAEALLESFYALLINRVRSTGRPRKSHSAGEVVEKVICVDLLGALGTEVKKQLCAIGEEKVMKTTSRIDYSLFRELFQKAKEDVTSADAFSFWWSRAIVSEKLKSEDLLDFGRCKATWTRADVVLAAQRQTSDGFLPSVGLGVALESLVACLHEPSARLRARGLTALSSIVSQDPEHFFQKGSSLRSVVEDKCLDVSNSVREAALEFLNRLAMTSSTKGLIKTSVLNDVYALVSNRLNDSSTMVRKRAVTIMRDLTSRVIARSQRLANDVLYQANGYDSDEQFIVTTCAHLVLRLEDPESTVKDTARKSLVHGLLGIEQERGGGRCLLDPETAARRLIGTTVELAKSINARFLTVLLEAIPDVKAKHTSFFQNVVDCIVRDMHIAEGNAANSAGAEGESAESGSPDDSQKASQTYILSCSALLSAFAQSDAGLLRSHCRVLLPALKGIPAKGLDTLNARNILSVLEVCAPNLTNLGEAVWSELEMDLVKIISTTKNDLLASSAIRCLCVMAKESNRRRMAACELVETFLRFLEASRDALNSGRVGDVPWPSIQPALDRLGLFGRFLGFKDITRADSCFESILFWAQTETLNKSPESNTWTWQLQARDASLKSLTQFIIGDRRYVLRILELFRANLDKSCGSELLRLRVLSSLQEMLLLEEQQHVRASEERSSPRGKVGAEEDAEAGYLVGSIQSLQSQLLESTRSLDSRVRLKAVVVLGLCIRQGLLLPVVAVPSLIGLYADHQERACREQAHRVLTLVGGRHPQMVASQALTGVLTSFSIATLTTERTESSISLAVDSKSGHALVSPLFGILPSSRRRELLLSIVSAIVGGRSACSEDGNQTTSKHRNAKDDPQRNQRATYLASTLASLEYWSSVGSNGVLSGEARSKVIREELLALLASIAKHVANTGYELSNLVDELDQLSETDRRKAAVESVPICLLIKVRDLLKGRLSGEAVYTKDVDSTEQDNCVPPARWVLDVSDLPLCEQEVPLASDVPAAEIDNQLIAFQTLIGNVQVEGEELEFRGPRRKRKALEP